MSIRVTLLGGVLNGQRMSVNDPPPSQLELVVPQPDNCLTLTETLAVEGIMRETATLNFRREIYWRTPVVVQHELIYLHEALFEDICRQPHPHIAVTVGIVHDELYRLAITGPLLMSVVDPQQWISDAQWDRTINHDSHEEPVFSGGIWQRGDPTTDLPKAAEWTPDNRRDIIEKIDEVIEDDAT